MNRKDICRPYLKILEIEIVLRLNIRAISSVMTYGVYLLQCRQEWISVLVTFPRINTAMKPIYRLEMTLSNLDFHKLLQVYECVSGQCELILRNDLDFEYQVDYTFVQKQNSFYVTGHFFEEAKQELFFYHCNVSKNTRLHGMTKEFTRNKVRWLYFDMQETSQKECLEFLRETKQEALIIECVEKSNDEEERE